MEHSGQPGDNTYYEVLVVTGWIVAQPQVGKGQEDPPAFWYSDFPLANPGMRIWVWVVGRCKSSSRAI